MRVSHVIEIRIERHSEAITSKRISNILSTKGPMIRQISFLQNRAVGQAASYAKKSAVPGRLEGSRMNTCSHRPVCMPGPSSRDFFKGLIFETMFTVRNRQISFSRVQKKRLDEKFVDTAENQRLKVR